MKAALLGVGHWGTNHIKVYTDLIQNNIVDDLVIYDINKDRAKKIAEDFKVTPCYNLKTILENQEIKMVTIATPSPTHFSLAKECLKYGKDILVEKPIALTSAEGWNLFQSAKESNRILLVGHIFRFHNALNELKKIIQRGDLGDIIKILIERTAFSVPRKDMGVLHALAIHDVDLACYLLSEEYPQEISAFGGSYYRNYPDEFAYIIQKFPNGTISISNESWLNPVDGKTRRLLVLGARGSAQINFLVPDTINIIDSYISENLNGGDYVVKNEGTRVKRVQFTEPLRSEIHHFVDCSLNEKELNFQADIGVRAVEMIEMAFESIRTKRTVDVSEYFERHI